jgi:hypothetical protein
MATVKHVKKKNAIDRLVLQEITLTFGMHTSTLAIIQLYHLE